MTIIPLNLKHVFNTVCSTVFAVLLASLTLWCTWLRCRPMLVEMTLDLCQRWCQFLNALFQGAVVLSLVDCLS